ncbi:hypothetical protein A3B60_01820 [Candidatus Peregrinibacteria bacterium RIFCSPLOWO2_01_FULL_39_12]|nr:MAG: hypothetical protein A3B60_01820 [Candidatus Peregrinibacteria bacterium RIFCSPLOWO2_01_FULL_39_12]OGJ43497.1 MAG: hypothetical protein A3I58_02535 [Candidatus Peregrinibacteria bacterium RIFCSPLOWO2_02_FULL_39_10]
MGMSLNKVQLIGNLTRDPEMRQIPGGQTVATFGVATNFTWKDQSGQQQSKVEFHNIVAWRRLAEICGQYLKKGSKIYIEGRLQTRDWEAEDGTKRYRTEIVADNMIMLDAKGREGASGGAMTGGAFERTAGGIENAQAPDVESGGGSVVSNSGAEEDVKIDDLPF